MEPLVDKLARQKPVRMIFETIRRWDKESDKSPNVPVIRFISFTFLTMVLVFVLFILTLENAYDDQSNSFISHSIAVVLVVMAFLCRGIYF